VSETFESEFRGRYLRYDEIVVVLERWQRAYPEWVRLMTIGQSPTGRRLLALDIGPEPDRRRPSVMVTANMHAAELAGSSVALSIAESVIRMHAEPGFVPADVPASLLDVLREVRLIVVPRIAVDGADTVLDDGRYVRSVPRDGRSSLQAPYWLPSDLDGNGRVLTMRIPHPTGEFVEIDAASGLMAPRQIEDTPPYYNVYPEGTIQNFDGTLPHGWALPEGTIDLNRNFPWTWRPEPEQEGAGAYPASEPEARAIVELATSMPELFVWIDFHTYGGVYIRPHGAKSDKQMEQADLGVYRQIETWAEQLTGYPMVSGYEEFTYQPDKPIYGDLADYAYHQRGCVSYVCELHDLFKQVGFERIKPFVDHYGRFTREDLLAVGRWDREHNEGRAFRPWTSVEHPQLGTVEVGGVDPMIGFWNPPMDQLAGVCARQVALSLRVFCLVPRIALATPRVTPLGGDAYRVTVEVQNRGYLPSYGVDAAREREHSEPLFVEANAQGCVLSEAATSRQALGHLAGWGRGLYRHGPPSHHRSAGGCTSKTVTWIVVGQGSLKLRAGSCRVGWVETTIEIP